MPFGSDLGSLLFVGIVLLAVFLVLDLLVAGGSMTCGVIGGIGSMMGGIAGAMGTPWGWGLLLLIIVIAGALLGGPNLLGGG